jgi:hemerythrin-like domain-containing protein
MDTPAIRLILDEHRALATVLQALRDAADQARRPRSAPDFERLRAMLFYLDDVPARLHHTSETELLFPRIRERCPALRPVLDRLEAEHERSDAAVRELEHALTAWQVMGDGRRESFRMLVHAYTATYLGHIEVEESYVLPVASDFLSTADWLELDEGLRGRRGALAEDSARGHRELFSRIVGSPFPVLKHP